MLTNLDSTIKTQLAPVFVAEIFAVRLFRMHGVVSFFLSVAHIRVESMKMPYLKSFLQVCDDQRGNAPRSSQRAIVAHVPPCWVRRRTSRRASGPS